MSQASRRMTPVQHGAVEAMTEQDGRASRGTGRRRDRGRLHPEAGGSGCAGAGADEARQRSARLIVVNSPPLRRAGRSAGTAERERRRLRDPGSPRRAGSSRDADRRSGGSRRRFHRDRPSASVSGREIAAGQQCPAGAVGRLLPGAGRQSTLRRPLRPDPDLPLSCPDVTLTRPDPLGPSRPTRTRAAAGRFTLAGSGSVAHPGRFTSRPEPSGGSTGFVEFGLTCQNAFRSTP